jgi:CHRD domain
MKKTPMKKLLIATALLASLAASQADPLTFKLSPPGTSPGTGLSPANEVPAVTNSAGSGGEILTGITFDTNSLTLSFAVGYGSALGFTNLTAPASAAHIHGPAGPTNTAGVLFDLAAAHLPAGDPAQGGLIFGSVVYTPEGASNLLAGLNYLNIHTTNNPGGEIRAQLILVTNAVPTLECPITVVRECTSPAGALVDLVATVGDADGNPLTLVWTVNGLATQTNALPASTNGAPQQVHFIANFGVGTHQIGLSLTDSNAPAVTCSTTVTVRDTTPPEIRKVTATPSILWPPNHKMVAIKVSVVAVDTCGPVTSRIISVTSNEPQNGLGDGDTDNDWQITGALGLKLRAERSGKGSGRTYTITIEATDAIGNTSSGQVTVLVPHPKGKFNAK